MQQHHCHRDGFCDVVRALGSRGLFLSVCRCIFFRTLYIAYSIDCTFTLLTMFGEYLNELACCQTYFFRFYLLVSSYANYVH